MARPVAVWLAYTPEAVPYSKKIFASDCGITLMAIEVSVGFPSCSAPVKETEAAWSRVRAPPTTRMVRKTRLDLRRPPIRKPADRRIGGLALRAFSVRAIGEGATNGESSA